MLGRVLVANRGEVACRILRTLRRMRIESVAVYSEADGESRHVHEADQAILIGPAPARQSYLDAAAILDAAAQCGAEGIHPGYGFLSENAGFAGRVEASGRIFVGPTPEQIRAFGLKHTARRLAREAGVALLPGSDVLASADEARRTAAEVGYPVMLKSTGGGGGIGLSLCRSEAELLRAFDSVQRLGDQHFAHAGVYVERYVERARHVEVQIFGDGRGNVLALGQRDCSLQRRNQKVVEETPAPALPQELVNVLTESALSLARRASYRSAGTVEFIIDVERSAAYFLEVNTRLQVEHCVTEEVFGIDLVEWMIRTAAGEPPALNELRLEPRGHSLQARIYAEDPARDFRPCSGTLTSVRFPADARVETWIDPGQEIPPHYDPLLAKIVVHAATRSEAIDALERALAGTELAGLETNLEYVRQVVGSSAFKRGGVTTQYLAGFEYDSRAVDVISPGTLTMILDYPGRLGYWDVGIPPSGPMDDLGFRLANRIVGNPEGLPALEITVSGPTLCFRCGALVALGGAALDADLDGEKVPAYTPLLIRAGQTLRCGKIQGPGARAYLAVRNGFDAPEYLGSRATFSLGRFGGHAGRPLQAGDVVHLATAENAVDAPRALPEELTPRLGSSWTVGVLYGPHGAPDFFTAEDIAEFFATEWRVHYNSARTGVRLIGPKPRWARKDGGEAGLHPSNIHDCAYAVGAVDFTGDMPIILGPDGPSLGGFVCPATVVAAELWKIGQLRPGDGVRFAMLSEAEAEARRRRQDRTVATLEPQPEAAEYPRPTPVSAGAESACPPHPVGVSYRRAGDDYLLVEYGPMTLDLRLRLRAHLLLARVRAAALPGIIDLTPGIRSLQIHFDSRILPYRRLEDSLIALEQELPRADAVSVPSRIVHMPLSWDDPATQLAIEKYTQSVRRDAPWAPSNIEFIRRINGLDSVDDVKRIVFDASYLVLGLGDVYLGAPVATPMDPRHRLVTTKYNPARTWTPENAVGIGGAYLCIYGMEGPGGYQFVGRTLQVYNRFRSTRSFPAGRPWLLDFFDQIRFYPVSTEELTEIRRDFIAGRFDVKIEQSRFDLGAYQAFLAEHADSIASFKSRQQQAFEAERERWTTAGELLLPGEPDALVVDEIDVPDGALRVDSPVSGSIWKVMAAQGTRVSRGTPLVSVESMKMEVLVEAPCDGVVLELSCREGSAVSAGHPLLLLQIRSEGSGA